MRVDKGQRKRGAMQGRSLGGNIKNARRRPIKESQRGGSENIEKGGLGLVLGGGQNTKGWQENMQTKKKRKSATRITSWGAILWFLVFRQKEKSQKTKWLA